MAQAVAIAQVEWEIPEQVGLWQDAWQRFRRNKLAVAGLALVVLLVLIAISGFIVLVPTKIIDPYTQHVEIINQGPSPTHIFGTDDLGRDMLARILAGTQISLSIGIVVQVLVLLIGGSIGLVAGYFGGQVDNLLMRFVDIWYAFPDLLFLLFVVAVFGQSFITIFVAIGTIYWVGLARLVRGQVLSIKEKEYVEAAHAVGSPPFRIMLKHLVPNAIGPVIVALTFGIPQAILLEATLSYLGVGIRPPTPSWGLMIYEGNQAIFVDPAQVIFPAAVLAVTLLAFTFIGDGLRDALDPRMRR